MNIGAFAVVISVGHHGEDRLQVEDYAGLGWAQPLLGVLLTIFLLSLAGFPGTGGFMGKIYLLQGAVDSQLWTLSVILVLTTVASYWYYLRVAWFMWMRDPASEGQHDMVASPMPMSVALIASVVVILYLGIFPSAALDFARASIQGLGAFGSGLSGVSP
jgi:NADH-quinone oxidoreductase subunit N